jgi:hypothetical protein
MSDETKQDIGERRWAAELRPVLKMAETRGFVAELVRELNRVSKPKVWMRQQVDRYLHPDPEKRIEPLAGIGLVFLDAAKRTWTKMNHRQERKESNG